MLIMFQIYVLTERQTEGQTTYRHSFRQVDRTDIQKESDYIYYILLYIGSTLTYA